MVTRTEATAVGRPAVVSDRAAALRAAIETAFPNLRRSSQLYVWRAGLPGSVAELADLADEVVQEAVVRALGKSDTFDPSRSARAWLLGFVANVIHERRRLRWRERATTVTANDPDGGAATPGIEQIADLAAHHHQRLHELLDLVPPADRQVLRLRYVDGFSGRELAATLGVTEGAARVRLSRALERLRRAYHQAERAGTEGF